MSLADISTVPWIIGVFGFGATAIAYAILAILVLNAHPGTRQADWLVAALVASALWGGATLAGILTGSRFPGWLPALDAVHLAVWVLFLAVLLMGSADSTLGMRLGRALVVAAVLLVGSVIASVWGAILQGLGPARSQFVLLPMVGLPILGLLALEQVFRNATLPEHVFLKPLSIALGTVLAADVFVYSQAAVFSELSLSPWLLRGIANVAVVPVLLLAIKRQPDWGRDLFVSRPAVFYTTGLIGAGLYLILVGLGGFVLGTRQGAWVAPIQIAFLVCAAAIFVAALFSSQLRRHFKVFLSKHFFRDRYDYRAEWLRLTRALAEQRRDASLAERSLHALTAIIASSGGELWMSRGGQQGFDKRAVSSRSALPSFIRVEDEMAQFLRQTFWVVDTLEYAADPEKYTNAFAPDSAWIRTPSIVVPLIHERRLVGIVRLDRPALLGSLDFRDHDLLKTAGRQIAVSLAQEQSQEQLSETRQLEAFGKLTTFLMHDLKNLIAQQELVVGNARRFRHRPEFIDDAMNTIDGGVRRMRQLLERLQGVTSADHAARTELDKVIREACDACSDRRPRPTYAAGMNAIVSVDRHKLGMILTHAIRNAQDATVAEGDIAVRLSTQGLFAVIEVEDTGVGMDTDFIRNELFKPFSSTKGAQGMGIGAYQIRETVRGAGGDVEVTSQVGKGTVLCMKIPLSEAAGGLPKQSVA